MTLLDLQGMQVAKDERGGHGGGGGGGGGGSQASLLLCGDSSLSVTTCK
jgi:hypothetical protein